MGANLSSQDSGRSRRGQSRRRKRSAMSEINVTPFVDVMLVLLIVFMVTAPMLTAGVAVDLPRSQASQIEAQDDNPLEVTVKENGDIFIGETKVEEGRLIPLLMVSVQNDMDKRIYVRADESLDYGRVMEILGSINSAGLRKVALVSKQQ